MKIKELDQKLKYYESEATGGHYHNPYDYDKELTDILGNAYLGIDPDNDYFDYENKILQFAGANNPLYLVRNSELQIIRGDRKTIALDRHVNKPFVNPP